MPSLREESRTDLTTPEFAAFYNFHAAGIEVTMSNISSVLFCCHGNDFV
jgi:hypothetical protein